MVYIVVTYADDAELLMESTGPSMATGMLTDILVDDEDAPLQLLNRTVESVTFTTVVPEGMTAREGKV